MKGKYFYFWLISIFFLALFLRFYQLEVRPLHFDEGNDAIYFIKNIAQGETVNFHHEKHGLLTYYLTSLPLFFLPANEFTLRLIPALFGSLLILALALFQKNLGKKTILIASLILALSPSWVYYSRFLISYPFFAFFLLIFLGLLIRCQSYQSLWLRTLAALSFTSLLLINEVWIIQTLIFLLFLVFFQKDLLKKYKEVIRSSFWKRWLGPLSFAGGYFLLIQTNFLRNWENLPRWINSLEKIFLKTDSPVHQKNFFYYFQTFFVAEWPLAILTLSSLILIIINHRLVKKSPINPPTPIFWFLAFWTGSSWLTFSLIPYKTPWVLSLLTLPTILFTSLLVTQLKKTRFFPQKTWQVFLLFLLGWYSFLSIYYNFIAFAAPQKINPLSYGQVGVEIRQIIEKTEKKLPPHQSSPKILLALDYFSPLHFYLDHHFVRVLQKNQILSPSIASHFDLIIIEKSRKNTLNLDNYSRFPQKKVHNLGNLIIITK